MDWGIFRPQKSTAILIGLLLFSFILMTFRLTRTVKNFRTFLLYWISPVQEISSDSMEFAGEVGSSLIGLIRSHQENLRLKERILQASVLETQYKEAMAENERLRRMLEIKSILPFATLAAKVTTRDALSWTQTVWIDRGVNDDVSPDSPVVAVQLETPEGPNVVKGLVGRVLECGNRSSKVLLISDPLSSVAVSIPRVEEQGLAQGQGSFLTIEYLDLASQAKPGDEIVTSGLGGIFPAGIPVGLLSQVEVSPSGFRRGILKPAISLNQIREVLVLKLAKQARLP